MFEFWCEWDINPLIIFDNKGNIKYCNQEAEIFLSYINKKEVFQFTINNAPKKNGIKTNFESLKFKDFEFMGYSIGYQNNNEIGVRFFINTNLSSIEPANLEKIELSMLLNFAIEYISLKQNTKISAIFDPSIPPIMANKKELLNIIFEILEEQKEAKISTKIQIGEYMKIKNKKYPIIEIEINTYPKKRIKSPFLEILNKEEGYIIKIPMIKEENETNCA